MSQALSALVAAELDRPVQPAVTRLAAAIAARHGAAARAVLFYGSCLRLERLDGLMLDFYLIVSDYRAAYGKRWLTAANRLLPPNVFPFEADGLAAKYAVLSEDDFARLASSETLNVSVWARFAQPVRLVWRADEIAAGKARRAAAAAAPALLAAARPLVADGIAPLDLWRQAFALTYGAELRAERGGRAQSIVDHDPAYYLAMTLPALAAAGLDARIEGDMLRFDRQVTPAARRAGARRWRVRRLQGKALTLARLAKATATFAGGIEYLAWKISRHSGVALELRPWQRRHPILGAISLLPRLFAKGAIR